MYHPSFTSAYHPQEPTKAEAIECMPTTSASLTIPYGDSGSWPVTPVDEGALIPGPTPPAGVGPAPTAADVFLSSFTNSPPPTPPHTPRPSPVSLSLLLEHFPDLPKFMSHAQLPSLVRLWYQFQQDIALAREPALRVAVQENLSQLALQADRILQKIFYWQQQPLAEDDPESDTTLMLTALCRFKERVEVMQQVLQIIENGRVWFNQDPTEAVMPILQEVLRARHQHVEASPPPPPPPEPEPSSSSSENMCVHPAALSCTGATTGSGSSSPSPSTATASASSRDATPTTSSHDGDMHPIAGDQGTPSTISAMDIDDEDTEYEQPDESDDDDEYIEPVPRRRSTRRGCRAGSEEVQCRPMLNIVQVVNNGSQDHGGGGDDDNVDDDDLIEKQGAALAHRRRSSKDDNDNSSSSSSSSSGMRLVPRRTATSYDAETTHYLKSVFFSIYSKRDKLTKEQRRQVQVHTGLKPRNITYWFSNHKRRFQSSLRVFKRTVRDSHGQVKTYDDFLNWRRQHDLPDEVMEHELLDMDDSDLAAASPWEEDTPSSF